MLRYRPGQSLSPHGDIYNTFDLAIATLNNKTESGTDASCLLEVLSMLHCSHVPIQLFEDAWKGSRRFGEIQEEICTSQSTFLSQWHISQLPAFVVAGQSGLNEWDPYRLNEASYLLESLALVSRSRSGLSMHPLVHAWAKDRQADEQQAQSWLITGCIIALSNRGSSLWQLQQRQLRPHIHSFLPTETAATFSRGPEEMILGILLECGLILLQMRDDSRLDDLLDGVS